MTRSDENRDLSIGDRVRLREDAQFQGKNNPLPGATGTVKKWHGDGMFDWKVTWDDEFVTERVIKTNCYPESDLEPINETKKVMYCVNDVLAAAKYLSRNNTLLRKEPDDIYQDIIQDMHRCVKNQWEGTSIGGYTIQKSFIGDGVYECSVTVSPNFDLDLVYTTEEVV